MRPQSITRFDQLYLGSLALGVVNFVLNYDNAIAQLEADPATAGLATAGPGFMFGVLIVSMGISLLLWWLAARGASNAARWILAVFTGIGLIGLPLTLGQLPALQLVVTLVITAMQVAAMWFLFRPDAAAWFKHGSKGMDPDVFE